MLLRWQGFHRATIDPLVVGYLSHLAADLLTTRGLRLAWRSPRRQAIPRRTGSFAESIIVTRVAIWLGAAVLRLHSMFGCSPALARTDPRRRRDQLAKRSASAGRPQACSAHFYPASRRRTQMTFRTTARTGWPAGASLFWPAGEKHRACWAIGVSPVSRAVGGTRVALERGGTCGGGGWRRSDSNLGVRAAPCLEAGLLRRLRTDARSGGA
jgi:hypothetical protein